MRLLIVTFDPPENIGGVEGRARAYTQELLKKKGNAVELISFGPKKNDFTSQNFHGTRLWKYPSRTKFVPKSLKRAAAVISKGELDSIFLLSGALTLFGLALLIYGRIAGLKTGIFLYGKDILETGTKPFDRLALYLSPLLARRVLVNSKFTESLLPRIYMKKARLLYPGIDPDMLEETKLNTTETHSGMRVLFVGRLVKRKGVDDLLVAFKELAPKYPELVLEIVGDGPDLQRLVRLAEGTGVSSRVVFYGKLQGKPLFARYSEADIFVMPSRRTKTDVEGFGTVFLEAGLLGKPSIGTRSGGIPEAIIENHTGLLVNEGDVAALTRAIVSLLEDEKLRFTLGKNAQKRILSDFTWEKSTNSLVEGLA